MPVDYSKFDAIEDSDEEKDTKDDKKIKKAASTPIKHVKCANCGDTEAVLKACQRCKKVAYCGARCQRDDWRFHKRVCCPPKDSKKKEPPSKPKPPKKTTPAKVESSDDDDDEPLTWYKHRETKLPDSNVQHVKLPSTPSEENLNRKDSAGSAWNSAGTWEERDVLPKVRERIEDVVKRVSDRDFGSGVISVDRVKSVTGDASVGVIRGKARQFLDVKIEVAFRVRVGGDETAYKGTLILKDYSADAATEPVDVEVKFSDAARVPAHVRDAVRGALGHTGAVEAGATGTFARDVVGALAAELLPGLKDL